MAINSGMDFFHTKYLQWCVNCPLLTRSKIIIKNHKNWAQYKSNKFWYNWPNSVYLILSKQCCQHKNYHLLFALFLFNLNLLMNLVVYQTFLIPIFCIKCNRDYNTVYFHIIYASRNGSIYYRLNKTTRIPSIMTAFL